MPNLLMISGDRALAEGKHGAFYNTLEEFHKYWEQIDIICPSTANSRLSFFSFFKSKTYNLQPIAYFGNVFIHPSPWPLFFQSLWILKKGTSSYKKYKFQLMTVHEYPPFYNGLGACLLYHKIKVPYVLEVMHIPGYPKAGHFKEIVYKWLMRVFIAIDARKAVAVRVINQKQTPNFLIKAGVKKDKLVYIPAFYIDLNIFKPLDVEKRYDLVFAARLEKNKGIFELLRAIAKVKTQISNIKLLIVGSGPLKLELNRFIENHDLKNNITFSGWLSGPEDVAHAYNSAKCFINPSYNEGGPRVVLEAMACGLPVITTPVGLMLDIIKDGENALFTDWDTAKMMERILYLLNNQKLQDKFSVAGLELMKKFERKSQIENYAKKLQELI